MMVVNMVRRWVRLRKYLIINCVTMVALLYYFTCMDGMRRERNLNATRRDVERRIEEALKEDQGSGCMIPKLDPFAKEVMQFERDVPPIKCSGHDWVRCYLSTCKVSEPILMQVDDIKCVYRDILYKSDNIYHYGPPTTVLGNASYVLENSDHVKVECEAVKWRSKIKWLGYTLGFRKLVPPTLPPIRDQSFNVLIFGFDSTSRNGFMRRMPKSYKVLTEELEAVVLNGYNIVGDGTPAALFPILTGKTELELPDVRKLTGHTQHLDSMPFIFYALKDDGYRTAFFEDSPSIGTFQYRFNGFLHQPSDHYFRAFSLAKNEHKVKSEESQKFCCGDRPQFSLMMDITTQFFKLDTKKYCFTFVGDITHDDFNWISTADNYFVDFLRSFKQDRHLEDTLLFVMGDHGPRYAKIRDTLQGKQEERLPLMAIALPKKMTREHREYLANLEANADTLTTPFDIHSTILEAIGLSQYKNPYKVNGAALPRSLSLLQRVPSNRTCSEAGIAPHWCACLKWRNVSEEDALYDKAAYALVDYINALTESHRSKCAVRNLVSIEWVTRQVSNSAMMSFKESVDMDGYIGLFGAKPQIASENFEVKIAVSPGYGLYEASMKYYVQKNEFIINSTDISRINAYGDESKCISSINSNLNMYCYCDSSFTTGYATGTLA